MALDRNGRVVVAGDKGTWPGLEADELKVVSVLEFGKDSRLEVCKPGEESKRVQIQSKEFTKIETPPEEAA